MSFIFIFTKKNEKAFTLFTALVSFIVIGIAVLVMQHISNSEQNYSQIISALQNQQEMDAAKDLIRLDSLQVFNVLYRAKFYDYYGSVDDLGLENFEQKKVYHDTRLELSDWSQFKKFYIQDLFFGNVKTDDTDDLGNKFSVFVADRLLSLLSNYSGNFKGSQYFFRIFDYKSCAYDSKNCNVLSVDTTINLSALPARESLSNVFKESYSKGNFLTLINCTDNKDNCDNGSFYTNIYANNIPSDLYLNLPRITIKRNYDNSAMDDSIFPRNVISMYMPMRLFGSLNYARNTFYNLPIDKFKELSNGTYSDEFECNDTINMDNLDELSKKYSTDYNYDNIILNNSFNSNDFNIFIDKIIVQKEYDSDIFIVNFSGNSIKSYKNTKLQTVRIDLSVTDNNPNYSFGRTSKTSLGYYGVLSIEEEPKTHYIICNCENKESQESNTYVNCTKEDGLASKDNLPENIKKQLGLPILNESTNETITT